MVYYLANQLPKRKTWHIFLNNFYTSLPLLATLRDRLDIGACGTAKPGSRDFPSVLAIPKKDVGKVSSHFKAGLIIRDVGILLWFDNAPVPMMTTIHYLKGEKAEILRDRNRPGRKSTNHKRALVEFGDEQTKEILIPVVINDYNFHMGGVDIADHYRSYYDTQLSTFRTWFPIFFWVLDTALVNSYIIFRDHNIGHVMERKQFRLEVAWDLILEGVQVKHSEERRSSLGKRKVSNSENPENICKKVKYVSKSSKLPDCRGTGEHLPMVVGGREECWLCRYRLKIGGSAGLGNRGFKTQWRCFTCKIPLCI